MLAERLVGATKWLRAQPETARLALGYIGSDIGSAAALAAAARLRAGVCAVVTCGGRPDWANRWLSRIVAPVLMISVEADARARARSRDAQRQLRCVSDLAVVRKRPGTATGWKPGSGWHRSRSSGLRSISRKRRLSANGTAWRSPDMAGAIAPGARPVAASDGLDAVLSFLIDKPLAILGILVAAFIVGKLARRLVKLLVRRLGRRRARRGPGLVRRHTPAALRDTSELMSPRADQRIEALAVALAGATSFVVWLVATLAVLHVLGVRLGPLLTGAGLIGVALGFGAQSLIRDFIAGVFILVEDQFGVGDWVDLGEVTGAVEAVTLRATRIRSVDGTVWHLSNGQIQRAGNMSQHWSRALLDVQIALDSDIDRAREAMKRVADELWHEDRAIIEEPEVWGVQSLGPAGITIRLVAKTKPLEQWRITRLLRERIKAELDREGIDVPPPTPWNRPDPVAMQSLPR